MGSNMNFLLNLNCEQHIVGEMGLWMKTTSTEVLVYIGSTPYHSNRHRLYQIADQGIKFIRLNKHAVGISKVMQFPHQLKHNPCNFAGFTHQFVFRYKFQYMPSSLSVTQICKVQEGKKLHLKNLNAQNGYIILQGAFAKGQLYTTNLPFEYKCGLFDTTIADKQQGKSEGFESCDRPIVRKRPIWVKIGDVLYRVTLKFDGWPWKTTGHLSFAVWSFVQHFIAVGEFKLELQSKKRPIWVKFHDF